MENDNTNIIELNIDEHITYSDEMIDDYTKKINDIVDKHDKLCIEYWKWNGVRDYLEYLKNPIDEDNEYEENENDIDNFNKEQNKLIKEENKIKKKNEKIKKKMEKKEENKRKKEQKNVIRKKYNKFKEEEEVEEEYKLLKKEDLNKKIGEYIEINNINVEWEKIK